MLLSSREKAGSTCFRREALLLVTRHTGSELQIIDTNSKYPTEGQLKMDETVTPALRATWSHTVPGDEGAQGTW